MKHFTLLILILLIFCSCANARTATTITPLPIGNPFAQDYESYPRVSQIESTLFGRNFENENIYYRLERIERKIFRRTNSNLNLSQRLENILAAVTPTQNINIPINELARIENKLFARTYPQDDIETRVIRLEKEMLGAMQNGDLEERYQVIASAAKHYNAFPYQTNNYQDNAYQAYQQDAYNSAGNSTGTKGFFKNILGIVAGGALTGFTPPLYNYPNGNYNNYGYPSTYSGNAYNSGFWPQTSNGFSDCYSGNNGYRNTYRSYGTGSGVNILYD